MSRRFHFLLVPSCDNERRIHCLQDTPTAVHIILITTQLIRVMHSLPMLDGGESPVPNSITVTTCPKNKLRVHYLRFHKVINKLFIRGKRSKIVIRFVMSNFIEMPGQIIYILTRSQESQRYLLDGRVQCSNSIQQLCFKKRCHQRPTSLLRNQCSFAFLQTSGYNRHHNNTYHRANALRSSGR